MAKMVGVTLTKEERAALLEMSKQDTRYPWDEMRFLIRGEARRRGLWTEDEKTEGVGDMETFASESARLMGEYARLMQEAAQGMHRALASQQEAMAALAERVALLEEGQDKLAEALRLLMPESEAGE